MPRLRPFRRRAARADDADDQAPEWNDESGDDAVMDDGAVIDYEAPIEPFVPVSAAGYDEYDAEEDDEIAPLESVERPRRRRVRLPHLRIGVPHTGGTIGVQMGVLLTALALVAFGIFGTLLVQDRLRASVEDWWPLALVIVAALWMLIALVRRQVALFLGGAGFAGVGLSLLLDAQAIAQVQETLLGVVLVTVGLGIVIRGFLLRRVPA